MTMRYKLLGRTGLRGSMRLDDPNGGAHRKSLVQSLEASLRRLGTDYIDLYWVHIWDAFTPVEEVVGALDDVVSADKVLDVGVSDAPAWIVAQAVTLADLRGWTRFAGLQAPYSLVERSVERELLPMAQALELTAKRLAWLEQASHIQLGFPHDFDAGHRRACGDTWPLIDNHRAYAPGPSEEEA